MKKFECQRCGICCTNIGGRFSDRESRVIEMAFRELEKIGVYLMLPPNKLSIPLFPDEVKIMIDLSRKLDIDFRPKPKLVILDRRYGHIVIEWDMGSMSCPFFDPEKGCLIYNYRPLVCKSFPIILKPEGYEILDICPEAENHIGIDDVEIERVFPDESRYAKMFNKRIENRKRKLIDMVRRGIILPSKIDRGDIESIRRKIIEDYLREPSRVVDILSQPSSVRKQQAREVDHLRE